MSETSDIKLVDAPAGVEGSGFFATAADQVLGIARANSLWPLPFATSCCGIEFMATAASHYDIARFGAERMSFSPRRPADGYGHYLQKNGAGFTPGLLANGRTTLGTFHGRLRLQRRNIRYLF